jgi:hypothetical protein
MPSFIRIILSLAMLMASSIAWSADIDAYEYLNGMRKLAGMSPFSYNRALADAAQNHANYLHIHKQGGHGEQSGRRGFTGQTQSQRVIATGYPSSQTGENVSYHVGNKGVMESIDGLMAAIYHRFAFLSFKYDEVGIGRVQSADYSAHVYNFGNQQKSLLCQQKNHRAPGRYFYEVCADPRFRISVQDMQAAEYEVSSQNADRVVWPADNSENIPPAFYREDPDPLPNHDVSGYPISVQFNPAAYPAGLPAVTRFQLFREDDQRPLETITLLDATTDRNRKFEPNEHALFPLHRLGWDTQYRAELDYVVGGKNHQYSWTFKTRRMTVPMVTVTEDNPAVLVKPGDRFALYVSPRGARDGEAAYSTRFPHGMNLDIDIHDPHTLIVSVSGIPGQATISFHGIDIALIVQPE